MASPLTHNPQGGATMGYPALWSQEEHNTASFLSFHRTAHWQDTLEHKLVLCVKIKLCDYAMNRIGPCVEICSVG